MKNGSMAQCSVCLATFPSFSTMLNHKSLVHNELIPCPICRKTFKSTYSLSSHSKRHGLPHSSNWSCSRCKTNFPSRKLLGTHFATEHKENYGCDRCGKFCVTSQELQTHLKVDCEHIFRCDTCGYTTTYKQSMRDHQKKHLDAKDLFKCSKCPQRFFSALCLEKHKKVHDVENAMKFTCEVCGKGYRQIGSLRKHRMCHHPEVFGKAILRCSSCHFVTKSVETFERHRQTHFVLKHICDICKKSLSCSAALKIHRNIHTGDKPFTCLTCKKSFSSPNYLRKHNRIHSGISSFARCPKCLHKFPDSIFKDHVNKCQG